ncbi:MAG: TonB-dependent receptor, partial [Pseudomonadota bacterium]
LIDDTLAMRIAIDRNQTDGFIDNPALGIDDQDREERLTLRAGFRFDPTDDFSAVLKFTRTEDKASFGDILASTFPERREFLADIQDTQTNRNNALNLRMSYDISSDFRIESETTYLDADVSLRQDPDDSPLVVPAQTAVSQNTVFEQELKLFYTSDRIDAVIGGFFADIESTDRTILPRPGSIISPLLPPDSLIVGENLDNFNTTNFAIFGEVDAEVLPDLRLIVGARYDRETTDTTGFTSFETNFPPIQPLLPPNSTRDTSATYDAFLPKVGAVYSVTDDLSLGATVQRGYRAGGASFNTFTGEAFEFDPEFTWNYELALRSQWFDRQLTVNANLFYTDWTDQQIQVPGPSGDPLDRIVTNAGASRLFGGELEVRALAAPGLEVFGTIGYVNTKFTDFSSGDSDFTGNEFAFAPEVTAALGVEYYFENGLFVASDASFTDSGFTDLANTSALQDDSRFLVNARLGYEAENWGVFGYVSNLFDVDYRTRVTSNGLLIQAGPPRQFGLVGQINF